MNYEESKIYKIKSLLDESQFYVGSTTSTLEKRLYQHKSNGINNINRNVHIYFINNGWNNANIELIENYPCKNKDELLFRETYWINELKPTLNMVKARLSKEEKEHNKKEYNKKYCEKNKEIIKERQKQYYNNNQEKIQEYRDGRKDIRKEYDREYTIKNKERKANYKLQYNNENRDNILEKKKEKILCECGEEYSRTNKARHVKTKKHLDHINK
jgi:hypothetical protein